MGFLYDELVSGPLAAEIAPHIASGDDGAIFAILSRRDRPGKQSISTHDIKQYLSLRGLRLPIKESTAPACKEASLALEDFDTFDCNNPIILAKLNDVLNGLVSAPLEPAFIEADKAAILALGDTLISRLDQLSIRVSISDIATALRG